MYRMLFDRIMTICKCNDMRIDGLLRFAKGWKSGTGNTTNYEFSYIKSWQFRWLIPWAHKTKTLGRLTGKSAWRVDSAPLSSLGVIKSSYMNRVSGTTNLLIHSVSPSRREFRNSVRISFVDPRDKTCDLIRRRRNTPATIHAGFFCVKRANATIFPKRFRNRPNQAPEFRETLALRAGRGLIMPDSMENPRIVASWEWGRAQTISWSLQQL